MRLLAACALARTLKADRACAQANLHDVGLATRQTLLIQIMERQYSTAFNTAMILHSLPLNAGYGRTESRVRPGRLLGTARSSPNIVDERRWSPRATLLLSGGVSLLLWGAIGLAVVAAR